MQGRRYGSGNERLDKQSHNHKKIKETDFLNRAVAHKIYAKLSRKPTVSAADTKRKGTGVLRIGPSLIAPDHSGLGTD